MHNTKLQTRRVWHSGEEKAKKVTGEVHGIGGIGQAARKRPGHGKACAEKNDPESLPRLLGLLFDLSQSLISGMEVLRNKVNERLPRF